MKDDVLVLFQYAVENNYFDMIRGLYPEVINSYKSDPNIVKYAEEAISMMGIRLNNMRIEQENIRNEF